jgi:hypothetical protein
VSFKDRWVGPREQVLNVSIACRWYGSGKASSLLVIDVYLFPLFYWLAREKNWVRTRGSVNRCAVNCVGSPFSWEQWLCPTLSMTHERLPRTGTACRKRMQTYMDWRGKHTCCVDQGFPLQSVHWFKSPWPSNMSTLVYDSHHADNLIAWIMA